MFIAIQDQKLAQVLLQSALDGCHCFWMKFTMFFLYLSILTSTLQKPTLRC